MLSVHNAFKLNGFSFKNKVELLTYVSRNTINGEVFLKSWFDENDSIIVQTSGSTGTPKEINIQKQFMLNSAKSTGVYFDLIAGTTALLCMSSDFIAGKMMWVRALSLGWELDVVSISSNPLNETEKNYDFAAMVPLQVFNSINQLNSVKTLIVGGGVVSKELKSFLCDLSTQVYATYGMTETVTHIAVKKLNHIQDNTVEYYNTLPSVKITKDTRGCLVIDAPLVSNKKIITNDLVKLTSDNMFEWLGRYDTIINSGGIKLIPEKIENKISKIISNSFFMAGLKDAYLGEKLVLIVEGQGETIDTNNKIKIYLKNIPLKPYEVPKEIYFVGNFERTDTGKIKRTVILSKIN